MFLSLASRLSKKGEKVQAVTLLHIAGPDTLEVYNTFTWEDKSNKNKPIEILEKFEAYCIPWKNVTWQLHLFNTSNQSSNKSFDQYLTDLKTIAQLCEFNDFKDNLIRARIICGIICDKTCSMLLKEPDLTLQRACTVEICRTNELTTTQMKWLGASGTNTEQIGIEAIQKADIKRKPVNNVVAGTLSSSSCPATGAEWRKHGKKPFYLSLKYKNEDTKPP